VIILLSQKVGGEKVNLEADAAAWVTCSSAVCPPGVQAYMIPGIYGDEVSCLEASNYTMKMDANRVGGFSLAKECVKLKNTDRLKKSCQWLKLSYCDLPYLYVLRGVQR